MFCDVYDFLQKMVFCAVEKIFKKILTLKSKHLAMLVYDFEAPLTH